MIVAPFKHAEVACCDFHEPTAAVGKRARGELDKFRGRISRAPTVLSSDRLLEETLELCD